MFSYKSFFPFPPSLPYASHRLYVEDAQCDVPQDHFKASVLAACTLALTEQILQHGGGGKKKKKKKEKKKLIG